MWNKKESKLSLAADMVRKVMPVLQSERNVVILCDSWYAEKDIVVLLGEFPSPDIICNARTDSVIYDLAPEKTGKKGRPAKSPCLCNRRRQGVRRQAAVFQHSLPDTDPDLLCMAGG